MPSIKKRPTDFAWKVRGGDPSWDLSARKRTIGSWNSQPRHWEYYEDYEEEDE